MKKLGLCACYNHKNYGSQLQSYATTVELKKRNIDYEIIRYKKKITPLLLTKAIPRLFNPVFINDRIIETFQNINGYKYDRLLIDSLLELDNELNFQKTDLKSFHLFTTVTMNLRSNLKNTPPLWLEATNSGLRAE